MFFERPGGGEQAVLVHLEGQNPEAREDPQGFQELMRSAGTETVMSVSVFRHQPNTKYFIGNDKIEGLHDPVKAENVESVIFNHTLTPSQERSLERALGCRVLDRTGLILDIFAQRVCTHGGKLQVKPAQLEHMDTRLVRGWTHFERQKGSIGLRGPGKTQLEAGRRLLHVYIRQIKQHLEKVHSQREQTRRGRKHADIPAISLVDYTSADKLILFGALTASEVYAASQLFAILDPTLRRLQLDDLGPMVLTDTVSFIRHLPYKLVEAFRIMLEESGNADLPLCVIDAYEPERDTQVGQVLAVLGEVGANELPMLRVHNKVGLLPSIEPCIQCDDSDKPVRVWPSTQTGEGLDLLRQIIAELLGGDLFVGTLRLPQQFGRLRAQLFELDVTQSETHDKGGCTLLQVRLPRTKLNRLASRAGWQPTEFVAQHTL